MRMPLMLIVARARRRPGRWLLAALGVALGAAFAGTIAAEGTITGDRSARYVLSGISPADTAVRVSWTGPLNGPLSKDVQRFFRALGLARHETEVLVLNPVRLSGVIVDPVAMVPLSRWVSAAQADQIGSCSTRRCPMLRTGPIAGLATFRAANVRIDVVGSTALSSPVPLGFVPRLSVADGGGAPVLLTGDIRGLGSLAGLSGAYRTYSWVAPLADRGLHSWDLAALERRLGQAQAELLAAQPGLGVSVPLAQLDEARAAAGRAPDRLLLIGGGAAAALALFVVLAAAALGRDQQAELARLRTAGATATQCAQLVLGESAWICALAVAIGFAIAIGCGVMLAGLAGVPTSGVLNHSLLRWQAVVAALGIWLGSTALIAAAVSSSGETGRHAADTLAVAALAALAFMLALGGRTDNTSAALLAPLCCLAGGVLTWRLAAGLLRGGELVARSGPVLPRLALVGLARAPAAPSLAIAFVAVNIGLGGFALAYRATLTRGTADQAANQVPLDATISPGPNFVQPLAVASLDRWRSVAGSSVLPIRTTVATYIRGGASVTVPALGIPARGLPLIHGWRERDGSASLTALARRLAPPQPVETHGAALPPNARALSVRIASPGLAIAITAALRNSEGSIRHLALGTSGARASTLTRRLPRGRWELEAFELDEPTGLAVTNGHQNGESQAPTTRASAAIRLGQVRALDGSGRSVAAIGIAGWRAVGAAGAAPNGGISFSESGQLGLLRPRQETDLHPLRVLVDPGTEAAAGPGGRLTLDVDGFALTAVVVGVLDRFPTVTSDQAGFVIADEATLATALDGQLPGQGAPDLLWIGTANLRHLRAAMAFPPLDQLDATFRADVQHRLRADPIARGMLGTLVGAAGLAAALALIGLLLTVTGSARDRGVERDLAEQGMGPRAVRSELRMRAALSATAGVAVGFVLAVLITGLAVASVRAAASGAPPEPPLVTVAPWTELIGLSLAMLAGLLATCWIATRSSGR